MLQFLVNLTASGGLLRVRASIALSVTGAIVYLFVRGEPVPDDLQKMWVLATAFYFIPRIGTEAAKKS